MLRIEAVAVLTLIAAASESLGNAMAAPAIRWALALPREICVARRVGYMVDVTHLVVVAGVVFITATALTWSSPAGRIVARSAAFGAVLASAACLVVVNQSALVPELSGRIGVGPAFDVTRWGQALITACGATAGSVVGARRGRTRG